MNLALGTVRAQLARSGPRQDDEFEGAIAQVDRAYELLRAAMRGMAASEEGGVDAQVSEAEVEQAWQDYRRALIALRGAAGDDDRGLRRGYDVLGGLLERMEVAAQQRLSELREGGQRLRVAEYAVGSLFVVCCLGWLVSYRAEVRPRETGRAGKPPKDGEALWRSYLDEAPIAVLIAEADGRLTYCNRAAAQMTGFAPDELKGRWVEQLHPEKDAALARAMFERFARDGQVEQEIGLIRAVGEPVLVVLRAVRLTDGRSIAFCADVTERRRAAAALRESHALMRSLVEQAPLSMAMFDRQMRYVVTSRRWLEDYGQGRESVVGLCHYDLFPDLPEEWKAIHRRGLAGETVRNDEDMWVQGDGSRHWLRWIVQPWRDARGEIGGLIFASENITPRKRAEEELRESEAQLRAMGDNLPDSYVYSYTQDAEGRPQFLHIGAGVERIHGCTVAEVMADAAVLHRQIDSWEVATLLSLEEETKQTLKDFDRVFRFTPPGGGARWLHVRSRPRRREDGQVVWDGVATDVTEQKRAAEALRENEERFRALVTLSPDAVFINQGGRIVYMNQRGLELWRAKSEAEVIGADPLSLIHPDSRELVRNRIRNALERRTIQPMQELKILALDGTPVDVETTAAVFDLRGAPAIQVLVRDITRRIQAQRQIEEQTALLEETGRIAKIGGWSFDVASGVGTWTDEVARIHDLDPRAPTSREIGLTFYTEESRQRIEAAIKAAVEEGKPYDLELEMRTAIGAQKWVRTIGHVTSEGGRVTRLNGSFQDITETRRSESALRESEARLKAIVDNLQEGLVVADADTRLLYWNHAAVRSHGFDASEDLNRRLAEFRDIVELRTPDGTLVPLEQWPIARLLRGEVLHDFEANLRRKDRDWARIFSFSGALVEETSGRKLAVLTIRDITEYKRLEHQFLRAQRMEAIGTLAGGVAHDLNNILAPVLMATMLLKSGSETEEEQEVITLIERSAKRGAGIVQQLLTFSRGIEGARAIVQPRHLVREMAHLIRETFPRNIKLEERFDGGGWSVIADATHLDQVLMNLCVNARDAMPQGGTLSIGLENVVIDDVFAESHAPLRPGRHVLLKVTDTGEGIPSEIIERIFDPFFTTKGVGKGTGLGLSTVLGIVRSHGGHVTVYSQPGRGTEFRVYLPAAANDGSAAEPLPQESLPRGRGELLLVVDDEAPLRETMRRVLERQNYRVIAVDDGAEALRRFVAQQEMIRLVITDMMMPGMDGLALVQSLRVLSQELRIVATSGLEQTEEVREKLARLNVTEFVRKPCAAEAILRSVDRLLHA